MKRLIIALLVFVLCSAFIPPPPELPSSFWGYTTNIPEGAVIEISTGGVVLTSVKIQNYNEMFLYYTANVTGGHEGDALEFRYRGALVGVGVYHVGTNQRLDLLLIESKKGRYK